MAKKHTRSNGASANLGFEAKLWAAADALRNNMDAAEYKHLARGVYFVRLRLQDEELARKVTLLR